MSPVTRVFKHRLCVKYLCLYSPVAVCAIPYRVADPLSLVNQVVQPRFLPACQGVVVWHSTHCLGWRYVAGLCGHAQLCVRLGTVPSLRRIPSPSTIFSNCTAYQSVPHSPITWVLVVALAPCFAT
jgi:hypothetical protein